MTSSSAMPNGHNFISQTQIQETTHMHWGRDVANNLYICSFFAHDRDSLEGPNQLYLSTVFCEVVEKFIVPAMNDQLVLVRHHYGNKQVDSQEPSSIGSNCCSTELLKREKLIKGRV